MTGYVLPTNWRLQCLTCGTPVEEVETPRPYQGVIVLRPCGHEATQAAMEAWIAGAERPSVTASTEAEEQRIARLITSSIAGSRWRELTPLDIARHLVANGVRVVIEVDR